MSSQPKENVEATESVTAVVGELRATTNDDYVIDEGGKTASAVPSSLSDAITKTLDFLSSASNETLTACLVGTAAATYMVLGRVGLLIIGVAGGVVLHASWEGTDRKSDQVELEKKRRREAATEIAYRLLDWRKAKASDKEDDSEAEQDLYAGNELDQVDLSAPLKAALEELIDAAIRDYVRWWYTPLLPRENNFPSSCRKLFTSFILSMNAHLSRKRPADTFLDFLTNSSSIVIVFLHELTEALGNSNESAATAIEQYLEQYPDSNLANVLDLRLQRKKFSMVAEDILNAFLEPSARNCEPVRLFMREMIGGVMLEMTLDRCSKPEWINGWIVYLLEETTMNTSEDSTQKLEQGYHSLPGDTNGQTSKSVGPESDQKRLKRMSKAEEAMEEAMAEAKRLSQLIAEEEERKQREAVTQPPEITTEVSPVAGLASQEEAKSIHNLDHSQGNITTDPFTENQTNGFDDSSPAEARAPATTFEQFLPASSLHASLAPISKPSVEAPLTLHNASISLMEGTPSKEKSIVRSKPAADYLIQIEPASSAHSGWMIVRKYTDFEMLHEVLRRISVVSGVTQFTERHAVLPDWRGLTNGQIRMKLQQYLGEALRYQQLAESEGMKRFLEKEQALRGQGSNKQSSHGALGWPSPAAFETMGKGMLEALAKAPTQAAEGGKSFIGGVTGVLGTVGSTVGSTVGAVGSSVGNLGQRKGGTPTSASPARQLSSANALRSSSPRRSSSLARNNSTSSIGSGQSRRNDSEPSARSIPVERRTSIDKENLRAAVSRSSSIPRPPTLETRWDQENALRIRGAAVDESNEDVRYSYLPPLPSEITDDYTPGTMTPSQTMSPLAESPAMRSGTPSFASGTRNSSTTALPSMATKSSRVPRPNTPLNEQETRVALELMFAMVSELYSLSSAWTLRRTLLTAAKNYLLRPGNPSMDSIRLFLQDGVIETTISDIPHYIKTVRKNSLPTEKELAEWPPELTPKEAEALRIKARKLLVEKGMPSAVSGVMGAAATGEALGKVFDCLQIEKISRGLMFGILLQALRATVQ